MVCPDAISPFFVQNKNSKSALISALMGTFQTLLGTGGELAQMVERPLRMREVPGSIPAFFKLNFFGVLIKHVLILVRSLLLFIKGKLNGYVPLNILIANFMAFLLLLGRHCPLLLAFLL